jgi:hypothetical protein
MQNGESVQKGNGYLFFSTLPLGQIASASKVHTKTTTDHKCNINVDDNCEATAITMCGFVNRTKFLLTRYFHDYNTIVVCVCVCKKKRESKRRRRQWRWNKKYELFAYIAHSIHNNRASHFQLVVSRE